MFLIDEAHGEGALAERSHLAASGVILDASVNDETGMAARILADSRADCDFSTPVNYTLQAWQLIGGARQWRGVAEGLPATLQALVYAASVVLVTADQRLIEVELTEAENGIAQFREPRRL